MYHQIWKAMRILFITLICSGVIAPVHAQIEGQIGACDEFAYSTEEDFITQGPVPADGIPIISDGDLLNRNGDLCARNRELLRPWKVEEDLGLDAVDLIFSEETIAVFSTELDDPEGRFTEGDLLATNGAIIPNQALLTAFQVSHDMGLDGLHLVGEPELIATFLEVAAATAPDEWLNGKVLPAWLERYKVDIWFSVEGTELRAAAVPIYDGDLLSARTGSVVLTQAQLLPASVPAGIPNRGVDFGLDGITGARLPHRPSMRLSTELLYNGEPAFTDGDILRLGAGVEIVHGDLIVAFEPRARFLGVDALYMYVENDGRDDNGSDPDDLGGENASEIFLPLVTR